jgi:hypothetical protein
MRSGVGHVCLLANMTALAALGTPTRRIGIAQVPESAGTFTNSNGSTIGKTPGSSGPHRRPAKPKPTANAARETIDELERAKARAPGTAVPQPTPRGVGGTH